MPTTAATIVEALAARHRVILLGGLAVIAHGLSRRTDDSDIWLDPSPSLEAWCEHLNRALAEIPDAGMFDVSRRTAITPRELPQTIDDAGMVRVTGLDRYLDVFYQPNQLDLEDFEPAWNQAPLAFGAARVMDEAFLIATKLDTGRKHDQEDIAFLEAKLRHDLGERLRQCPVEEATATLARYLDHATAEAALQNPDPAVRALGRAGLEELAAGGNPFAIAALKRIAG